MEISKIKIKSPKIRFRGSKVVIPKKLAVFAVSSKFRRVFKLISDFKKEAKVLLKGSHDVSNSDMGALRARYASEMLKLANIKLNQIGQFEKHQPALFVGNHLSYLDIPVLVSAAPVVFVAKKEILRWPIIGKAAKYAGTVFVKRSSKKSRRQTLEALRESLVDKRQSIAVFPSGTTSLNEHIPWRWGTFEVAKAINVPIQPFRLTFKPLRKVAYIDDDIFVAHLWMLLLLDEIEIHLEFGKPFYVNDPQTDAERVWKWTREIFQKHNQT